MGRKTDDEDGMTRREIDFIRGGAETRDDQVARIASLVISIGKGETGTESKPATVRLRGRSGR